jgi:hypothetical protein
MNYNYKRTFDAVHIPQKHHKRIREELSSRYLENRKEDNIVNIKSRSTKRLMTALIAAVLMLSLLTVVGFAYSSQIIELLGGNRVESGRSGGWDYVSYTITEESPAEVRDGKVFFILDGNDKDITGYVSETSFYEYEHFTDEGWRHVVVVGGTPDNLGWADYVWNEIGDQVASGAVFNPDDIVGDELVRPRWLELADAEFKR